MVEIAREAIEEPHDHRRCGHGGKRPAGLVVHQHLGALEQRAQPPRHEAILHHHRDPLAALQQPGAHADICGLGFLFETGSRNEREPTRQRAAVRIARERAGALSQARSTVGRRGPRGLEHPQDGFEVGRRSPGRDDEHRLPLRVGGEKFRLRPAETVEPDRNERRLSSVGQQRELQVIAGHAVHCAATLAYHRAPRLVHELRFHLHRSACLPAIRDLEPGRELGDRGGQRGAVPREVVGKTAQFPGHGPEVRVIEPAAPAQLGEERELACAVGPESPAAGNRRGPVGERGEPRQQHRAAGQSREDARETAGREPTRQQYRDRGKIGVRRPEALDHRPRAIAQKAGRRQDQVFQGRRRALGGTLKLARAKRWLGDAIAERAIRMRATTTITSPGARASP